MRAIRPLVTASAGGAAGMPRRERLEALEARTPQDSSAREVPPPFNSSIQGMAHAKPSPS